MGLWELKLLENTAGREAGRGQAQEGQLNLTWEGGTEGGAQGGLLGEDLFFSCELVPTEVRKQGTLIELHIDDMTRENELEGINNRIDDAREIGRGPPNFSN